MVGLTDVAEIVGVSRQNMRKSMLAHPGSFPAQCMIRDAATRGLFARFAPRLYIVQAPHDAAWREVEERRGNLPRRCTTSDAVSIQERSFNTQRIKPVAGQ
jgi:hypothetical protein